MAKERRQDKTIEELRQQIAHTRDRLGRDLTGLRYELDVPLKFRKSFQRHSGLWISAVTLLGTLFTIRPARRRKTFALKGAKKGEAQKKGVMATGLAMGGLRLAASLLRPVVVSLVTKKMRGYAGRAK